MIAIQITPLFLFKPGINNIVSNKAIGVPQNSQCMLSTESSKNKNACWTTGWQNASASRPPI